MSWILFVHEIHLYCVFFPGIKAVINSTSYPSRRLSVTERKFGYADLLEEIGVPRFLVEDETDADGDLSTVLVRCAVLPSLVANLLCTLCRKHTLSTPAVDRTAPSAWCVASRLSAPVATRSSMQLCHQTVSMGLSPICRGEISCVGKWTWVSGTRDLCEIYFCQ